MAVKTGMRAAFERPARDVRGLAVAFFMLVSTGGHGQRVMSEQVKAGEVLFWERCAACHESGLRNAPLIGNRKIWASRIAKGEAVLLEHAIHGFNRMPPRGGHPDLGDEDLHNIVRYMIFVAEDL